MKRSARILVALLSFVLLFNGIFASNAVTTKGETQGGFCEKDVIQEYFGHLNNGDVEKVIPLLYAENRSEYENFVSDESNKRQHIGLFNYKGAELVSISAYTGSYNEIGCTTDTYNGISQLNAWECIVDVETYIESEYLTTGKNRFVVLTGINERSEYVILEVIRDRLWSEVSDVSNVISFSGISTLSYDAPVSALTLGTWQTPITIKVQGDGTINFKQYWRWLYM